MKNIHRERIEAQARATLGSTPWAIEERKREEAAEKARQFWDDIRAKRDARITVVQRIRNWWRTL